MLLKMQTWSNCRSMAQEISGLGIAMQLFEPMEMLRIYGVLRCFNGGCWSFSNGDQGLSLMAILQYLVSAISLVGNTVMEAGSDNTKVRTMKLHVWSYNIGHIKLHISVLNQYVTYFTFSRCPESTL